jgi:hypothetical protein
LLTWAARVLKEAIQRCLAKGGRRLWRQIARSIKAERDGAAMRVEATHVAAAQKQFGGSISAPGKLSPRPAKLLAIPVDASVDGVPAYRYIAGKGRENVSIIINPRTQKGVIGIGPRDNLTVLYALTKQTRPQRPDPFMPAETEIDEMGIEEAVRMLEN